jgi:hypothetical protein
MKSLHGKLVGFICVLLTLNTSATVRYVDVNGANATPPYLNWNTAATNIQDAIDAAVTGDLVLVTNGVYETGGRTVPGVPGNNRVVITKALTVQSVNGPQATFIRGFQIPGTTNGSTAVRCVALTNNARLVGFTLMGGATPIGAEGGGARGISPFSCTLSNCVLTANAASLGGGAYGLTLDNCRLSTNAATSGGGANGCNLNNCELSYNSAVDGGGAYLCQSLAGCTIIANTASGSGGGASSSGANNTILYYNSAPTGSNYFNMIFNLNVCCTTPLPPTGSGNITNEPLCVDFAAGNFRLQPDSPCLNGGLNGAAVGTLDLDGLPRIVDHRVDMGAYEFPSIYRRPGQVAMWGLNDGITVPPELTKDVVAIASGSGQALALKSDHTLVAWQYAFPSFTNLITDPIGFVAVAVNEDFWAAIKTDGTVKVWGNSSTVTNFPSGVTDVIAIAPGHSHGLVLKSDGTVITWGTLAPAVPSGLGNVAAVAVGFSHSAALKTDGTVVCWGTSAYGLTNVPANATNIVSIAAGANHNLALKADGTVIAWGFNGQGQTDVPVGLSNVVAISAGFSSSLALRDDGTLVWWGYFGTVNSLEVQTPLTNSSLPNIVAISMGLDSLMLLNDPRSTFVPATNPVKAGESLSFSLASQKGSVYAPQYKNSLADSLWTRLPLVRGNGGIVLITDPAASGPQRFYGVRRW